jgi:hypothetical protein
MWVLVTAAGPWWLLHQSRMWLFLAVTMTAGVMCMPIAIEGMKAAAPLTMGTIAVKTTGIK